MNDKTKLGLALLLLPVDYLSLLLSVTGAYFLRLNWPWQTLIYVQPFADYFKLGLVASLGGLLIFALFGLYRLKRFSGLDILWRVFGAVSIWVAVCIIILFGFRVAFFSRLIMGFIWLIAILGVSFFRIFFEQIKSWLARMGLGVERILLIGGNGDVAERVRKFLHNRPGWGMRVLDKTDTLEIEANTALINKHKINSLIICASVPEKVLADYFILAEERGLHLRYFPSMANLLASNVVSDTLAGYPIWELRSTPLDGWGKVVKRVTDIGIAGLGLIVGSPILMVVALAVKLTSKGPIIFKQERIGERGKPFTFYKFRSMYTEMSTGEGYGGKEAEALREKLKAESNDASGVLFKVKNDPRITKVGKFIRATSLDELPQLWNVLIGNMSFVGPRPALAEEVAQYSKQAKRRLLVKPGLTGLWQVSGRVDVSYEDYVKLDIYYIEHWSWWFDWGIILRTVGVLLTRKGGY